MNNILRIAPLIPLAAALGLGACGEGGAETPAAEACVHSPPLSWADFGDAFMTTNCTPCHHSLLPPASRNGAPLGVDFDTYGDVLTWRERIRVRSLDEETMPPGGGIGASDLALLDEWLGCQVAEDAAAQEATKAEAGQGDGHGR